MQASSENMKHSVLKHIICHLDSNDSSAQAMILLATLDASFCLIRHISSKHYPVTQQGHDLSLLTCYVIKMDIYACDRGSNGNMEAVKTSVGVSFTVHFWCLLLTEIKD